MFLFSTPIALSNPALAWTTQSPSLPDNAIGVILFIPRDNSGSSYRRFGACRASSADPTAMAITSNSAGVYRYVASNSLNILMATALSSGGTFQTRSGYIQSGTFKYDKANTYLVGYVTDDEAVALDPMLHFTTNGSGNFTSKNISSECPKGSAIWANVCYGLIGSTNSLNWASRMPSDPTSDYGAHLGGGMIIPLDSQQTFQYAGNLAADVYVPWYWKAGKVGAIVPQGNGVINSTALSPALYTPYSGIAGYGISNGAPSQNIYFADRLYSPGFSVGQPPSGLRFPMLATAHDYIVGRASPSVSITTQASFTNITAANTFDWRPSGAGYAKQDVFDFNVQSAYQISTWGTSNGKICVGKAVKIDSFSMAQNCTLDFYGTQVTIVPEREITVPVSDPGRPMIVTGDQGGLLTVTVYTQSQDITSRQ